MSDIFNMTDTWNAGATVFTAIRMDVADSASSNSSFLVNLLRSGTTQFSIDKFGTALAAGNVSSGNFSLLSAGGLQLRGPNFIGWTNTGNANNTIDAKIYRQGPGVVSIRATDASTGGALNFLEQTAPAAPAADQVVLYAEDNGAGKTRLMARFPTGAAQQVAMEP